MRTFTNFTIERVGEGFSDSLLSPTIEGAYYLLADCPDEMIFGEIISPPLSNKAIETLALFFDYLFTKYPNASIPSSQIEALLKAFQNIDKHQGKES